MTRTIAAALCCSVLAAAPAAAATFTGTTVGGPTYNRTLSGSPPTDLSIVGTDVAYDVVAFTVDQAGDYDFLMTGLDPDLWDTFLALYSGSFDPSAPLANVLVANDDFNGDIGLSGFTFGLTTGVNYFAIATGFANSSQGRYSLEISGPGTVSAPIPEPAAWALLIAGFGLTGAALRTRRVRVAFA